MFLQCCVAFSSAASSPALVPKRGWEEALLFEVVGKSVLQQLPMRSVNEGDWGKNCLVFQSHPDGLCALLARAGCFAARSSRPLWEQRGCPKLHGRWPASSPGLGCTAEFSDPLRALPSPPWLCTEFSGQCGTAHPPSPVVRAGSPHFSPTAATRAEPGRKQKTKSSPVSLCIT